MASKNTKQIDLSFFLKGLKEHGVTEIALLPFFLPTRWEDMSNTVNDIRTVEDKTPAAVMCRSHSLPIKKGGRNGSGRYRVSVDLLDRQGNIFNASFYEDHDAIISRITHYHATNKQFLVYCSFSEYTNNGKKHTSKSDLVPNSWEGKIRPVYKGKKACPPFETRRLMLKYFNLALPLTIAWLNHYIEENLNTNEKDFLKNFPGNFETFEEILKTAHIPKTIRRGIEATHALELISASFAAFEVDKEYKDMEAKGIIIPQDLIKQTMSEWEDKSGYRYSGDQANAIEEIASLIAQDKPLRHLLNGDVGTGKTAVFATIAACLVKMDKSVGILCPHEPLVEQIRSELMGWWPNLKIRTITGSSKAKNTEFKPGEICIGTTAILFRASNKPDLKIIDEQQRFSVEQRNKLTGDGTHLIEATATCIPRTMALAHLSAVSTSIIKAQPVKKIIHSTIFLPQQRKKVMERVKKTISEGKQVLFVYPEVSGKSEEEDQRIQVETAAKQWEEQMPGEVLLVHGRLKSDAKAKAFESAKRGDKKLIISTTVSEVGLTIPNLYHVVVVKPDRMGLMTLHQIRGRVARKGGEGLFDMYLRTEIKPETMERLLILTETNDGFKIAEKDLEMRGAGNLSQSSTKQAGKSYTFLVNRAIPVDVLKEGNIIYKKIQEPNDFFI